MVDTCAVFERRVRRDVCGDDAVKGKRQSRSRANCVNQIDSFATVFAISNNRRRSYEDLKAKGVNFQSAPDTALWGRFATFDDPDDNGWVLASEVAEA